MTKNLFLIFSIALCALLLFSVLASAALDQPAASSEQPAVGTRPPAFKLTNNEGKQVSLKDYKGKWVVLYFYPKDFT
ncbi:MAG TPA: redoxin domain-containing protein, partial [Pyrinomonadaceae bacterium]